MDSILYGLLKVSNTWHFSEKSQKDCKASLAYDTSSTDLYVRTNPITYVIRIPSLYPGGSNGLGNQGISLQGNHQQAGSTHHGLVRQPHQSQNSSILHMGLSQGSGSLGRFHSGLVNGEGFFLHGIRIDPQSAEETLSGTRSGSNYCPYLGSTGMVAINQAIPIECSAIDWVRFCEGSIEQRRTVERQLEVAGGPSRFSEQQLHLDAQCIREAGSIRDSTDIAYGSYRRQFRDFIIKRNTPVDIIAVEAFCMKTFYRTKSGSTVAAALHALRQRAKVLAMSWLLDILNREQITDLVAAMKKLSLTGTKRHRDPFPIHLLQSLVTLGSSKLDWLQFILVTALIALGLRSMARGGELAGLLRKDIKFTNNGMRVSFERTKTRKFGRILFIECSGSCTCPVALMKRFLELRDIHPKFASKKELFGDISTSTISAWLKLVAKEFEVEGSYTSHSLRIGGASQATLAGMSREMIMLLGDWTSDAVDRYLRSGVEMGRNVSKHMGL